MTFRLQDIAQLSQEAREESAKQVPESRVYTVSKCTFVTADTARRIDAVCKRRGISVCQFLRDAVRTELLGEPE